jgi:2-methylcitrate dehydratase
VAVALMDGKVDLDSFTPERIADPELHALVHRVKIVRNDELSDKYPDGIPNIVTVTTKDGRRISDRLDYAHGHPNNPLTDQEIVEKLKRLGSPYLSEPRMDSIAEFVFNLETRGNMKALGELCVWS